MEIWSWMFNPDPDLNFLPILDPEFWGQKGTGSRIRIRNTDNMFYISIWWFHMRCNFRRPDMLFKFGSNFFRIGDKHPGSTTLKRDRFILWVILSFVNCVLVLKRKVAFCLDRKEWRNASTSTNPWWHSRSALSTGLNLLRYGINKSLMALKECIVNRAKSAQVWDQQIPDGSQGVHCQRG